MSGTHEPPSALTDADALARIASLEAVDGDSGPDDGATADTPLADHFHRVVSELASRTMALKRQRLLYKTIVETMREITLKALDLNRFEQYTTNTIRGHFGVLKVWFFRQKDYGDDEIGVYTPRMQEPPEMRIHVDSPFADYVRHHPEPVDLTAPPREIADSAVVEGLRALDARLVQPLVKQDETGGQATLMGLIVLGPRLGNLPFTDADCEFLELLGSMIGVTLYNAHLYQRSIVDNLTQVYSRGHFDVHLDQELARAERANASAKGDEQPASVALVMLDIDHFKQFNDRYGHQVGDLVLVGVARALKDASRAMDVVCRYGGEEFGVIFPDVPPEHVPTISERLRKSVEDYAFETDEHGALSVTISLGVATYPDHALTARTLVARSDKALYAAKGAGRNCVVISDPDSDPDSSNGSGRATTTDSVQSNEA